MRGTVAAFLSSVLLTACRPGAAAPAPEPTPTPSPAPPQTSQADEPIRMAVTFDDMPGDPGAIPGILPILERHRVPSVYAFVNGKQVADHPEREQLLRDWLEAGHLLGSHTFSHPHMKEIGVDAYLADIAANEALLNRLAPGDRDDATWKIFRYPFLTQGFDAASTRAVRNYLLEHDYRIAEVSLDFGDWAFNGAYARCAENGDEQAIEGLKQGFLGTAWMFLGWAEEAGRRAFGRPIPHVLLLHGRALTPHVLDDLLTLYEKNGVVWIPLDEAMDHEVYREHVPPDASDGDSIIEQVIARDGADHPPWVQQPLPLLDAVCRQRGG